MKEQLSQLLTDWDRLLEVILALSCEEVENLLEMHVNSTDRRSLDDKKFCLISWGLIRTNAGLINTSSAFKAFEHIYRISESIDFFQDFKRALDNTEESMYSCSSRANRLWFSVNEISSKVRSSKGKASCIILLLDSNLFAFRTQGWSHGNLHHRTLKGSKEIR